MPGFMSADNLYKEYLTICRIYNHHSSQLPSENYLISKYYSSTNSRGKAMQSVIPER